MFRMYEIWADVPDFFSQLPRCLNCGVDGITVIPRSRGIQFAPLAQICVIWHMRYYTGLRSQTGFRPAPE